MNKLIEPKPGDSAPSKIEASQYNADTHSEVEKIKVDSNYLRGTIQPSLKNELTGAVADDDLMLIKFHGIYQQDDRDLRQERQRQKLEPLHSFMIRARVPGGVATAKQYVQMSELAKSYSNRSLRLTTRQAFQWHGVFKRNLKSTIAGINQSLLDTIAACGDVNRNVMSNPLPETSKIHAEVFQWSKRISEHLLPKTNAYHEIWLDGEKVNSTEEPIYGQTYLPRKFKTAIAIPPYNDVDVYANDLGLIAIIEKNKLMGFNVLVGGGMGSSHGDKNTYPRVASSIGFCTPEQVLAVAENVVKVQRDFGNREVRKLARLKYTIDRLGLEIFKQKLFAYQGFSLNKAKAITFKNNHDRYGWFQDEKEKWHVTLYIHSGRIIDSKESQLFSGLLEIAKIHGGEFRITPNQNLIISNIEPAYKSKIAKILAQSKISTGKRESATRLNSLACVAFPTCSLAMAEAERYLPAFVTQFEVLLKQYKILDLPINVRMTGCPNGCARPFIAEIGLVGKGPGKYNLYLGGGHFGERLNKLFKENIDEKTILKSLKPILEDYSKHRTKAEKFGDFCIRTNYIKGVDNGMDFHTTDETNQNLVHV